MTGRGGFFGRMLGGLFGQPDLGDKLGDAAWNLGKQFLPSDYANLGDAAFKVTDKLGGQGLYRGSGLYKGRGAYAANNLVTDGGATASNVVPVFKPTDLHTVTYSNREYVKDVFAPAAGTIFSIDTWSLNPGLVTSFPWLSQLAINFEEYEIVQLAYTYKSTVADFASASGQVGQIVMATQYNPNSDPFADKEEMMLYEGGMSCKTTESLIHGIECDPSKIAGSSQKYVRAGALPPTEDLKNYDLGKTSLAVLNVPSTYASQQIGELWVSYTVMLRKPKIASGNAYNIRRDIFAAPAVSVAVAGFIGTDSTLRIGSRNSLNCLIVQNAPTSTYANGIPTPTTGTDNLMVDAGVGGAAVPNATTTPYQFALTIPDNYSGCLRIRILMTCNTSNAQLWKIVSAAPNTIKRFRDIPDTNSAHTANIWTHVIGTYDYDAVASTLVRADTMLDIRVLPPAQGVSNTLYFTTNASLAAATYAYSLEITQLNTFLSVADNGKNDAIDLVTANGASAIWA